MEPGNRRPKLNVRVDPEFKQRVSRIAVERFQGNEAMVMRDALETYIDLRDVLGFDFDRTINDLLKRTAVAA